MIRLDIGAQYRSELGNRIYFMLKPFFDVDETPHLVREHMRAQIYLVQQPLTQPLPDDLSIDRCAAEVMSPWHYFRYNRIGHLLFDVLRINARQHRLRLGQKRCEVLRKLVKLQATYPYLASEPIANPLTGLPFSDSGAEVCQPLN